MRHLIAVGLTLTLLSSQLRATTVEPVTDDDLISKSSFIFEGVVANVRYRLSNQRTPNEQALPYTFVTFNIIRVFKGRPETPDSVTVSFLGGPKGRKQLIVPGIPLFDRGDRDVLFIKGTGTHVCPLVGWNQGRLRIVDERVFTDDGREVFLTSARHLAYGRDRSLKEALSNVVGSHVVAERRLPLDKKSPPSTGQHAATEGVPPKSDHQLSAAALARFISKRIRELVPQEELSRAAVFPNANFEAVLYAPRMAATPPPQEKQ